MKEREILEALQQFLKRKYVAKVLWIHEHTVWRLNTGKNPLSDKMKQKIRELPPELLDNEHFKFIRKYYDKRIR